MDRVVQRLEDIERNILNDPVFKTLASNSATAPFISLRIEELIKNIVNTRREQDIAILQTRVHEAESTAGSDVAVMRAMLAQADH